MTKTRWTLGCLLIAFAVGSALAQENYLFRIGRPEFSSEQKVELGVIMSGKRYWHVYVGHNRLHIRCRWQCFDKNCACAESDRNHDRSDELLV